MMLPGIGTIKTNAAAVLLAEQRQRKPPGRSERLRTGDIKREIVKESNLWSTIKRNLPNVHWQRIESTTGVGIPDINGCYNGCDFWIEIKYLDAFPKRPATPVRINHFTAEQKLWLKRRGEVGGRVLLFVQVGREYFLFDWEEALCVCSYTQAEWREHCRASWQGRCNWRQWLRIVTRTGV